MLFAFRFFRFIVFIPNTSLVKCGSLGCFSFHIVIIKVNPRSLVAFIKFSDKYISMTVGWLEPKIWMNPTRFVASVLSNV